MISAARRIGEFEVYVEQIERHALSRLGMVLLSRVRDSSSEQVVKGKERESPSGTGIVYKTGSSRSERNVPLFEDIPNDLLNRENDLRRLSEFDRPFIDEEGYVRRRRHTGFRGVMERYNMCKILVFLLLAVGSVIAVFFLVKVFADRGSANDPNEFLDEISPVKQVRHSDSEYALKFC